LVNTTTRDDDINIIASNKMNPFQTAVDILNDSGLDVSVATIKNRLKENGLKACIAARKEQLTDVHKLSRLHFARQYLNFNN
jgi:hypothetical protein